MVCSSVLPTRLQPQPRPVQGQGEILLSIFIGANACVSMDEETVGLWLKCVGQEASAVRREEVSVRGLGMAWLGRMEREWSREPPSRLGVCDRLRSFDSQNSVGVKLESRHQRILPAAPNFARIIFFLAVVIIVANFTLQKIFFSCLKYFPKYAQNVAVGLFVLSGVSLMVTHGQFRALGGFAGVCPRPPRTQGSEQDPEI